MATVIRRWLVLDVDGARAQARSGSASHLRARVGTSRYRTCVHARRFASYSVIADEIALLHWYVGVGQPRYRPGQRAGGSALSVQIIYN